MEEAWGGCERASALLCLGRGAHPSAGMRSEKKLKAGEGGIKKPRERMGAAGRGGITGGSGKPGCWAGR